MAHEFESGIFLKEPAWHRLGTVVDEWPGSWAEARKEALDWEVLQMPLEMPVIIGGNLRRASVDDSVMLMRDDKPMYVETEMGLSVNPEAKLSVQSRSYAVINNADFGEVCERVVGKIGDDWQWETLLCLSGGRMIVALLKARTPLQIALDPSLTHSYIGIHSRHDGQGGLRVIPTNVREVCKNTHNLAEDISRSENVGWTIRHTESWSDRVDDISLKIQGAMRTGKAWEKLANRLCEAKLVPATLDRLLESTFKTDSSMVPATVQRIKFERNEVRQILESPTCAGIEGTLYGYVQAVDEWVDHVKPAKSDETRFTRSWLRVEPVKYRALQLAVAASS